MQNILQVAVEEEREKRVLQRNQIAVVLADARCHCFIGASLHLAK